ncbi:hypothetical protein JJC03_15710 [Flavobacterium oreochromis]|uniref:hypothetical protein n=1 Tax=Flavobacterium oreochromis TaxID=2906078 RepID=UPI001CE6C7FE|nr:hypothetical protein [Flavobacterium oreochromis]QYS86342.1 hypothetical protein JJC03_15710 [Flavobacterium oreochromis]
MKKKLEAELISIAHKVLQLKHKEDVRELHREAQRLYEKLSVLLFVEENFSDIQPTIGIKQIEEKLERTFDYDNKVIIAELEEEEEEITENQPIETFQESSLQIEETITNQEKIDLNREIEIIPQIIENKEEIENISIDDFLNQIHSKSVSEKNKYRIR